MKKITGLLCAIGAIVMLLPRQAPACACGCNMFTVGNRWSMPVAEEMNLYLKYDYMNQSRNWGGWNSSPADMNEDREIRTNFFTLGMQKMFDRSWGAGIEVPVWERFFRTTDEEGNPASTSHVSAGDIRILGRYTGISEDMSTGLIFGVKLPTGSFTQTGFDRDTQIGTGTADLLLGAYRMGQESGWGWYAQGIWQHAFNERSGYRPGDSFDASVGAHYDGWAETLALVPGLQLAGSIRGIDSGDNAMPDDTGYERLYLTPGIQFVAGRQLSIYADLRLPLLTHVRGNQLVAPLLVSTVVSFTI
jgi:hypothetical protein